MIKMSKIFVVFHKNCIDGTGAKFAAWMKFKDYAVYVPVAYGEPVPDFGEDPNTEIYILDFSFKKEILKGMQAKYKKIVVLDHHKTAEEDLKELVDENIVFDMNRSGAVMAWNYFHPDKPVPHILQHVQDRDLWKFTLPGTKEVHAGLNLLKGNMGAWKQYAEPESELWQPTGSNVKKLAETGRAILQYENQYLENTVPKKIKVIDFLGYKAGIFNSGYLISETGEAIYNSTELNVDLAILYFIDSNNTVWLSFRSKKDGGVDVSAIAKMYFEGGGHQAAAGGKTTIANLNVILEGSYYAK